MLLSQQKTSAGEKPMDIFAPWEYLNRGLDATSARMQVLSNNQAHASDPGYQCQTVSFEDRMRDALQQWDKGDTADDRQAGEDEASAVQPEVENGPAGRYDMNEGMANMAKTQILYQALTARVAGNFSALKYVIDNSGH
jgi:flagellar basal-body rod protein FlgB